MPNLSLPAAATAYVCGAVSIASACCAASVPVGKALAAGQHRRGAVRVRGRPAVLGRGGQSYPLSVINLLQGTLASSIPLILGALAGGLCERSGVINIAIEGQLLFGAFAAAVIASAFGALWLGLIVGSVAGACSARCWPCSRSRYLVDQVILGVVLNVFASGLTGYLYDRALVPYQNTLNSPATFCRSRSRCSATSRSSGRCSSTRRSSCTSPTRLIALVQVGLFRTRWGLRVRAVGEHPTAADTVGIRVLATRYRNVIMGGLIAGIGGAFLTIGSVGSFGKDMSSGEGYIALAAMIFGRWTPLGATAAALLFGFTTSLQSILATLNVPIPSNILLMAPYVVTIVAVAGLVGKVRAPTADGQPYVKA